MALATGSTLQSYEILGPFGAGEVERAQDTRLTAARIDYFTPLRFSSASNPACPFDTSKRGTSTSIMPTMASRSLGRQRGQR